MKYAEEGAVSGRFLAELVFPGALSSVPVARHCVKGVLAAAGHRNTGGAQMVVGELVANAILHSVSGLAGGLVVVDIRAIGGELARIDVIDQGGPVVPRMREPGDMDSSGRGLRIVEATALRWGIRDDALGGRAVWSEVPTSDDSPGVPEVPFACAVEA